MLKGLRWLAITLLIGCGGSTKSGAPKSEATSQGGSAIGGNDGASGSSSRAGSGGRAGDDSAGGAAGAGAGGKLPDFPNAGAAGALACSAPYAGPQGGPRADGPEDLGSCLAVADDVVLARYKDSSARVPRGLYYEAGENIAFWNEPCSKSESDTVARGATDGMGSFLDAYTSEWFYEAAYCFNDSLRRVERNLRCDYFDGSKLAMPSAERLAFLASLLWWGQSQGQRGSAILGHSVLVGDAIESVDLCTISTTYGDFGLCDEVRLESTTHRLKYDGTVELGMPQVVRTLKGECH